MAFCRHGLMKFLSLIRTPFRLLKSMKIGLNSDFTLLQNWIPLLKVLRFFGNAPIQIKAKRDRESASPQINQPSSYNAKVHICISALPCTLVWAVLRGLFVLSVMYPAQFPWNWMYYPLCNRTAYETEVISATTSQTEKVIRPLGEGSLTIIVWLEWICLLIGFPDFVQFLNNWQKLGNPRCQIKTTNLQMVGCILFLFTAADIALSFSNNWRDSGGNMICNAGFMFVVTMFQILALAEVMKLTYMICAVVAAMDTVQLQVQELVDDVDPEKVFTDRRYARSVLLSCQDKHNLLKEQVRLIGASQGLHEVCQLCWMTFAMTILLFLTLSPMIRGEMPNKLQLLWNTASLLGGFIQFYTKWHYAEKITQQEKLFAETLYSLKLADIPEAKILADSIVGNPTKIVCLSMITMEKRVLLSIGSLILTYIIILLQFQLSFGTNQI